MAHSGTGHPSFSPIHIFDSPCTLHTMAALRRFHCVVQVLWRPGWTVVLKVWVDDKTVVAFGAWARSCLMPENVHQSPGEKKSWTSVKNLRSYISEKILNPAFRSYWVAASTTLREMVRAIVSKLWLRTHQWVASQFLVGCTICILFPPWLVGTLLVRPVSKTRPVCHLQLMSA